MCVCLKHPSEFPNQPQYPISQKHQQGWKPIITKLLHQGLLHPTHSPYNTPVLPVKMPNSCYRLVQGLRLISAAVIPIHPVVPKPYTLLFLIPSSTTHFTALDLKDAFFTTPLHPDSQDLFALTWTDPDNHCSQQLTGTVLPQGFCDSPHFFGQAWAQTWPLLTLLWVLSSNMWMIASFGVLCLHTQQHITQLLNFLADHGYLPPKFSSLFLGSPISESF